jgi:polar amino acid transport system substrate-binding protein
MNARNELAPSGNLRAGMNLGNTLFTRKNSLGELKGVSVDLMRELANRLEVPLEMISFAQPGQVADASTKDMWDVAILAIEKTRAQTISFSPAMTEIAAGYVVHQNSALLRTELVDAKGVKIAAPDKAGYELFLTGSLKNATLVRTPDFARSLEIFKHKEVEVLAGLKPNLMESMHMLQDAQLLDGSFMTVKHGFAVPHGREAANVFLRKFVKELISSGFISRSIENHQIKGLKAIKE